MYICDILFIEMLFLALHIRNVHLHILLKEKYVNILVN